MTRKTISIVIPVFNEQDALIPYITEMQKIENDLDLYVFEYVFVNDGSKDETLDRLIELKKRVRNIKIVDLSRNFGKESALTAGINFSSGSAVVPMDVDLQDPPRVILQMIEKWEQGFDVVLAKRGNRDSDSVMKRVSANLFYKVHNKLSDINIPENVGDFRLLDRKVVDALAGLNESCRFMKGLFAWLGFNTATVEYIRAKRFAGESKFNGWKLWNFALEGITSFSIDPLRIWTYVGLIVSTMAFIFAMTIVLRWMFWGVDVPGYASIIVCITILGGIQMIGLGVLGEYVGRVYVESKKRPVYLVNKIY